MLGPILGDVIQLCVLVKGALGIQEITLDSLVEILNKKLVGKAEKKSLKLHKWAFDSLKFTQERLPESEAEIITYIYRYLTILFRCTSRTGQILLNENYRMYIDSGIIWGINL